MLIRIFFYQSRSIFSSRNRQMSVRQRYSTSRSNNSDLIITSVNYPLSCPLLYVCLLWDQENVWLLCPSSSTSFLSFCLAFLTLDCVVSLKARLGSVSSAPNQMAETVHNSIGGTTNDMCCRGVRRLPSVFGVPRMSCLCYLLIWVRRMPCALVGLRVSTSIWVYNECHLWNWTLTGVPQLIRFSNSIHTRLTNCSTATPKWKCAISLWHNKAQLCVQLKAQQSVR